MTSQVTNGNGAHKLAGKVAIVTGGSRGLGAAIAKAFAAEGARVVVTSRTVENVAPVEAEIRAAGGEVLGLRCDVRDSACVQDMVRATVAAFGNVDVLVNNAASFVHAARFPRMSEEGWDEAWDTNVKGAWLTTMHTFPHMNADGSVINITSGLARKPSPAYAPYSLTKRALEGLTAVLAETIPQRVNAVNPGVVRTEMSNGLGVEPDLVAPAFVFLASDEARGITGRVLRAQDYMARGGIRDCPLPHVGSP